MGGDGAVDTLFREDLGGFRLRGVFRCCKSVLCIVSLALRMHGSHHWSGRGELDAIMTYLRWTMRPAGCTLRLGAAARRRPS